MYSFYFSFCLISFSSTQSEGQGEDTHKWVIISLIFASLNSKGKKKSGTGRRRGIKPLLTNQVTAAVRRVNCVIWVRVCICMQSGSGGGGRRWRRRRKEKGDMYRKKKKRWCVVLYGRNAMEWRNREWERRVRVWKRAHWLTPIDARIYCAWIFATHVNGGTQGGRGKGKSGT